MTDLREAFPDLLLASVGEEIQDKVRVVGRQVPDDQAGKIEQGGTGKSVSREHHFVLHGAHGASVLPGRDGCPNLDTLEIEQSLVVRFESDKTGKRRNDGMPESFSKPVPVRCRAEMRIRGAARGDDQAAGTKGLVCPGPNNKLSVRPFFDGGDRRVLQAPDFLEFQLFEQDIHDGGGLVCHRKDPSFLLFLELTTQIPEPCQEVLVRKPGEDVFDESAVRTVIFVGGEIPVGDVAPAVARNGEFPAELDVAIEEQDVINALGCGKRGEDACRPAACYDDSCFLFLHSDRISPLPLVGRSFEG